MIIVTLTLDVLVPDGLDEDAAVAHAVAAAPVAACDPLAVSVECVVSVP
jgi:hypothetical protein